MTKDPKNGIPASERSYTPSNTAVLWLVQVIAMLISPSPGAGSSWDSGQKKGVVCNCYYSWSRNLLILLLQVPGST